MFASAKITKVGLATIVAGRLLLVRKRGKQSFILPGGKPEMGESPIETLTREVEEELGCRVKCSCFERSFFDRAADLPNSYVDLVLYTGQLTRNPIPLAEIEELTWIELFEEPSLLMAPSIVNHILPYMRNWQTHRGAVNHSGR